MPDLDSPPTVVQRPAKTGRWRFGLRTLLIAVTLLAVTIGVWAESARRQRSAVAALLRCHANVHYDTFSGPAERSWFQTGPAGKPWEERLGMDFLYPVRDVTVFSESPVLDEEEFLPHIAALRGVRLVSIGNMPITNEGLRYFKGLHQLTVLDLGSTKLSEANVDHLQDHALTWLSVNRTRFSDRSLASLRDMHSLEYLDLTRTKVSDQGLDILRGLPNLKVVRLNRSLVTEAGYKALQHDLPNCKIHWELLQRPSPTTLPPTK